MKIIKLIISVFFIFNSFYLYSNTTTITVKSADNKNDTRYNYELKILKLALDKTRHEYGDYKLQDSPQMNYTRVVKELQSNNLENFIIRMSYEHKFDELGLIYAKFPIELDIVGYRVCFTNPKTKELLKKVKNIADLKKFTHGQGRGWTDVEILKANQFEVEEISGYENIFEMVANGRFDLFCRGANEIKAEYEKFKNIKGLVYDETFSIAYSLPRFFYSNSKNKQVLDRVEKGLNIAYKDGSLIKLWNQEYLDSVKFSKLDQRKIYWIDNPNLKFLNSDYRKYSYDPLKKN